MLTVINITRFSKFAFLFQLDDVIDLVIPRGSNKLVSQIKTSTKIPVLGHAGKVDSVFWKKKKIVCLNCEKFSVNEL